MCGFIQRADLEKKSTSAGSPQENHFTFLTAETREEPEGRRGVRRPGNGVMVKEIFHIYLICLLNPLYSVGQTQIFNRIISSDLIIRATKLKSQEQICLDQALW